jgi:tRNA (pseudouridine54-N1)-methyltransferase
VELYLVLQGKPEPPKTIRLVGSELKYLNPDERSTGALIRNALMKKIDSGEVLSTPGIYISRAGFQEVILKLAEPSKITLLREDGKEFTSSNIQGEFTFVLSDDKDFNEEEQAVLDKFKPDILSLGSTSYHSDHCITVVNWLLDKNP